MDVSIGSGIAQHNSMRCFLHISFGSTKGIAFQKLNRGTYGS